ncbi:hypothetical protein ACFVIM_13045 [Streptomyces sp. NPDC057638]|uniref:SHOCT-like domain-containing protein n=1 Tax=Streptomyces sp. NPDC057638 TaxID=3346190 RepID=UPI003693A3EE
MDEQRRQILEMLAEGKVTAAEAERLIDALERPRPTAHPGAASHPKPPPRYLRVVVQEEEAPGADGASRVNIRVPLQLLRAGVRLTSLIPPQALTRLNAELDKAGVPVDLTQLRQQDIEELIEHLADLDIDIGEPGSAVRVFCE